MLTFVQLSLHKFWTILAQVMVATSFIFSDFLRDIFTSIVFVFFTHPFDQGDKILVAEELYTVGLCLRSSIQFE